MKDLSILILDDEERVRNEIEEFLLERSYNVLKAEVPSEAYRILNEKEIDILILDIKLPEMDGLQFLGKIKQQFNDLEVIMISGHGDMNTVIEAMRLGAADYFPKPFRLVDINNAIERTRRFVDMANKLKKVEKQYSLLSKELQSNIGHQLIGRTPAMRDIVGIMSKVASADHTTVLITGESGTGKELVARGIHFMSKRRNEYFFTVNCSAIPETLFESEFFGHKKGSFTGADDDRSGWFEIANNGTLFLDEIGDMPMNQQAKLLRILDEKKVKKVGSHKEISVDVRVIAASNKDLLKLVRENRFRLDLYHRLSSFLIHIPPLKERKEDIPLLLNHFLGMFNDKLGKNIQSIDANIPHNLKSYAFPGNVRELKNLVERALILSEGNELSWADFENLLPDLAMKKQEAEKPATAEEMDLEQAEKELILRALKKSGYNKAKAAALLNITWQSLNRRMKKFGI
ncbi:MAG: sigma-54 dependent transcriptional regulator [Bacteroidetes bacterium]|nr:sigma-54 dependent transcriptional regulator [Bacteroidota bacterium]